MAECALAGSQASPARATAATARLAERHAAERAVSKLENGGTDCA